MLNRATFAASQPRQRAPSSDIEQQTQQLDGMLDISSSSPTTSVSSYSGPSTSRFEFSDFTSLSPSTSTWSRYSASLAQSPTLLPTSRTESDEDLMQCDLEQCDVDQIARLHRNAFDELRSATLEKEQDFVERMRLWEQRRHSNASLPSGLASPLFTADVACQAAAGLDSPPDDDLEVILDPHEHSGPSNCSRAAMDDLTSRLAGEALIDYSSVRNWQSGLSA